MNNLKKVSIFLFIFASIFFVAKNSYANPCQSYTETYNTGCVKDTGYDYWSAGGSCTFGECDWGKPYGGDSSCGGQCSYYAPSACGETTYYCAGSNCGESCVPNSPAGCASSCCVKCNPITSYETWGACSVSGEQYGSIPVFGAAKCVPCTNVSNVRTCGVCNASTTATATSITPTNLCTSGTGTVPAVLGSQWIWKCNGVWADSADDVDCAAPYVPAPNVTLSANPNPNADFNDGTNTLSGVDVDLSWNVTNSGDACVGGCSCTSASWSGAKAASGSTTTTVYYPPAGDKTFTVDCKNDVSGETGSDTKTIDTFCTQSDWTEWSDCNKSCGVGDQTHTRIKSDCTQEIETRPCAMPACPVSSEWREVKP